MKDVLKKQRSYFGFRTWNIITVIKLPHIRTPPFSCLESETSINKGQPSPFEQAAAVLIQTHNSEAPNTPSILPQKPECVAPPLSSSSSNKSSQAAHVERELVGQCLLSTPLHLQQLMQAGELKYIAEKMETVVQKMVQRLFNKQTTLAEFIADCLVPIMFLLKRQQNLDDFMKTLSFVYQKMRREAATPPALHESRIINLRVFLHVLLLSSDLFLRRIIMSLISKRNPVPLIEPKIRDVDETVDYEVMPSIIHVWNTAHPTLLSFGIGPCHGKSTLMNTLFQSTFERHTESVYFQCTIDIDFGYAFIPARKFNVADGHGQLPKVLLRKLIPIFDAYIIHISQTYLVQHAKAVAEILKVLPNDKFQIILVRDGTTDFNKQDCLSHLGPALEECPSSAGDALRIVVLPNISDPNNDETIFTVQTLRENLLRQIRSDVIQAIDKDQLFADLHKIMKPDYVHYLKDTNQIVKPLTNCLLANMNNENNDSFPLYSKFTVLCKLRQELQKIDFYKSDGDRSFRINNEIFQLENELSSRANSVNEQNCGLVYRYFIDLLKTENALLSLNILASGLKQELLSQGANKLAGRLSMGSAFLSLEVLWRNCVVCYDHTSLENQRLILDRYIEFMLNGFPFEIIDGDNFYCQQKFLTEIMKQFEKERILVISVIGPQNSGKSTLLNYMFGTLFDVRDGRCTRGIYGSLVKANNIEGIEYLLLIDTEGLLSIEKADKEYDRRLVLFCLAVSHLVIVNMLSDINETLKDMLTLCADSLRQLSVTTIQQPTIHFILNQKADPNIKNHEEAINKIIADLKDKDLSEIISISADTFHTLPSAFKKDQISHAEGGPCLLRTEPDFIDKTQQLVARITASAKVCYDKARDTHFNLP